MSLVILEKQGPIAHLILNNPDALNAMTHPMGEALEAVVPQINQNPDIRVVIIKGAGRTFSAGGDFNFILNHREKPFEENQRGMIQFYNKFLSLRDIEVPTIAQIHGPAVGAGFLIALACDLRYAAEGAKMGANFARIGLSSGMGGLYWLTHIAGPLVAADLLFTGRIILAEEAKTLGLINQVFSPEELEKQTLALAQQIAKNAPIALKIMKKGIQKAMHFDLRETLNFESNGQAQCFASHDLLEGISAIKEKRPPNFKGE